MAKSDDFPFQSERARTLFWKDCVWRLINSLATRLEYLDVTTLTPTERADLDVKRFVESTLIARSFGKDLGEKARALAIQAFLTARRSISEVEKKTERDYLLRTLVVAARGCGSSGEENEVDETIQEISNEDERQAALSARANALTKRLYWDAFEQLHIGLLEINNAIAEDDDFELTEDALEKARAKINFPAFRRWYAAAFERVCRVVDELEYQREYDAARVKLLAIELFVGVSFRTLGWNLRDEENGLPIDEDEPDSFTARLQLHDGEFARLIDLGVIGDYLDSLLYDKSTRVLEEARDRLISGVDADGEPLSAEELEALREEARGLILYSNYANRDYGHLRELFLALDMFDSIGAQLISLAMDCRYGRDLDFPDFYVEVERWYLLAEKLANEAKSVSERARRMIALSGLCHGLPSYQTLEMRRFPRYYSLIAYFAKHSRGKRFALEAFSLIDRIDSPLERCARCAELLELSLRRCKRKSARRYAKRLKEEILAIDSDVTREFAIKQHSRLFTREPVRGILLELLESSPRFAPLRVLADLKDFYRLFWRYDATPNLLRTSTDALVERALASVRDDEEPSVEAERIVEFTRAVLRRCGCMLRMAPSLKIGDEFV